MSTIHVGHSTYHLDLALVGQSQAGNYSTINIHIYLTADSGWSGFASGIGWSSYANGGTFSFDGTTAEVANYNVNIAHDANGYLSGSITANIADTGTATYGGGGTWSQGISVPRIPKVPGAPRNLAVSVSGRNATITFIGPADNGGSAITNYIIQYAKNGGAWTGTVSNLNGNYTYVSLPPGSYVFRVYAHNGIGDGPAASTSATTIRSGGKVNVDGAWQYGLVEVRADGVWHDGTVKVRVDGVWVDAL